jgi:hypothetical protein
MTSTRAYCAVFSAIVLACGMSTQAAERQQLHGHVPAAVAQMGLRPVGRLPSTEQLNLAIGLPLRNQELLGQMLQQIYDPATHGIISI